MKGEVSGCILKFFRKGAENVWYLGIILLTEANISLPQHTDRLWAQTSLLFCVYRRVKRSASEAENSPPTGFQVQNSWIYTSIWSIPVVARSKAWVCGGLLTGTAGSNPAESLLCRQVGLCVGPIIRPEESYIPCVCVRACVYVIIKPR